MKLYTYLLLNEISFYFQEMWKRSKSENDIIIILVIRIYSNYKKSFNNEGFYHPTFFSHESIFSKYLILSAINNIVWIFIIKLWYNHKNCDYHINRDYGT